MAERSKIVDLIGVPATYEQLAEEAAELAKAAQKWPGFFVTRTRRQ